MNPKVAALLREACNTIPAHEARVLLAYAIGTLTNGAGPADAWAWEAPDEVDTARFREYVAARGRGVPLQHITGVAPFRTVEVGVGPGVFVPRPETEPMTGWAIERIRGLPADRKPVVVELCAGSGAISLAIRWEAPGCEQYAVEADAEALAWARRNLSGADVRLVHADMDGALPELDGSVDLVIANPPYIPDGDAPGLPVDVRDHEPAAALFAGPEGLDAIRVVARVAARLLRPGGLVACEHGDDQGATAPQIFAEAGFDEVADHPDLARRPRFVTARWPGMAG